jgi:kinesin family protein 4/21/27
MKQSLSGNSLCLMIACLAPCDEYLEENVSTLTYATKAAVITSTPKQNPDHRFRLLSEIRT